MHLHSWWGLLASTRCKYEPLAARKIDARTRSSDRVRRGVEIRAANVPRNLMQRVPREENTSVRASSRSPWPVGSIVSLDGPVKLRSTSSIGRQDTPCRWISQRIRKNLTSLLTTESTLKLDNPVSPGFTKLFERRGPLWVGQPKKLTKYFPSLLTNKHTLGLTTEEFLRHYYQSVVGDAILRQHIGASKAGPLWGFITS